MARTTTKTPAKLDLHKLLIAALAAEGESVVRNVGIIRRGYEKLFAKLDALGADFDVIG